MVCAHGPDQMRASDDSRIRVDSNIHPTQTAVSTMSARAIWFVAATKKSAQNTLYMQCNVKPGASKTREGVSSVDDEAVGICVAAQAREGEANKAVIRVLSEVCISQFCPPPPLPFNHILQVLDFPKSDLHITQGLKSRSKTVAVVGSWVNSSEEECLRRARECLDKAVEGA